MLSAGKWLMTSDFHSLNLESDDVVRATLLQVRGIVP